LTCQGRLGGVTLRIGEWIPFRNSPAWGSSTRACRVIRAIPRRPQFANDIGPDTFASWLGAIAPGSRISLYLHVPFCRRLCWFCACRTQGTSTDTPVLSYVETLKAELRFCAPHCPRA
jgi:coproporphyrinogen III oxidase-like Fe-S oxidoreductase